MCGSFRVCAYRPEPVDGDACDAYQLSVHSVINVIGSRRLPNITTISGFLIFLLMTCLR